MTLDESYVSTAELIRRDAADRARQDYKDYCEQRDIESVENTELQWARRLVQQAAENPEAVHYKTSRVGYDTRLFGGEAS